MFNQIPNKNSQDLCISDSTLRDGNHAVSHQINEHQIADYCKKVDKAGADWVEVGHGNGLGASSFHIGKSAITDELALKTAREFLKESLLSVHIMPGIASINRDIKLAIDIGVDIFRVASHCTEANTTTRYIEYLRSQNKTVVGVLMMSHMADTKDFLIQAKMMESAGAQAIMLMDSAGSLEPSEIRERFSVMNQELKIPTGIHAHNNLGLATANTMTAVDHGAQIIDACIGGFGAGAGNAQIEIIFALLNKKRKISKDPSKYLELANEVLGTFAHTPKTTSLTIATGLAGIFSGFLRPIEKAANEFKVSPFLIIKKLGELRVVAGQEDMVREVALMLANSNSEF